MARRKEMQGICNDLLESFVSRYNDLDGYWAMGKFQTFLQAETEEQLCFRLVGGENEKNSFSQTLGHYRSALGRHLKTRNMPISWVEQASIEVQALSANQLICRFILTTDHGKDFSCQKTVSVRPHDPESEQRSGGKHGPKNQKGQ